MLDAHAQNVKSQYTTRLKFDCDNDESALHSRDRSVRRCAERLSAKGKQNPTEMNCIDGSGNRRQLSAKHTSQSMNCNNNNFGYGRSLEMVIYLRAYSIHMHVHVNIHARTHTIRIVFDNRCSASFYIVALFFHWYVAVSVDHR